MKLTQRDLTMGFREKIEVRVPVSAFFHIGLNACVDCENEKNQRFEHIYQFYTKLEIELDEETGNLTSVDVKLPLNFEGMNF